MNILPIINHTFRSMESFFLFNFIVNNVCGETENDTFFNWYFKVSDLLIHYHNFISSA